MKMTSKNGKPAKNYVSPQDLIKVSAPVLYPVVRVRVSEAEAARSKHVMAAVTREERLPAK
jgi:hypothetical protein